jgi:hypothetical protein
MNRKFKWSNDQIALEALKFETKANFKKYGRCFFEAAKKRDTLDLVCSHMKPNTYNVPWTLEELRKVASLYKKRNDFKKGNEGAYATARKRKILEEICQHMEPPKKEYSEEEIKNAALQFSTRRRFKLGSKLYKAALRKGSVFMDNICSHMKKSKGTSIQEQVILDIVLKHFPNAKKQRFQNKHRDVYGQSYFELDVYIPELNKGIEFDGTYWHSDSVIRKRSGISAEEYHKRKDDFFDSLGIKVLHISELFWTNNLL